MFYKTKFPKNNYLSVTQFKFQTENKIGYLTPPPKKNKNTALIIF